MVPFASGSIWTRLQLRGRDMLRERGRGEAGRRARFRSWSREGWRFESSRPHQRDPRTSKISKTNQVQA